MSLNQFHLNSNLALEVQVHLSYPRIDTIIAWHVDSVAAEGIHTSQRMDQMLEAIISPVVETHSFIALGTRSSIFEY